MWKKIVIGVAIAAGIVTVVIYSILGSQKYSCDVCIRFKGRDGCGKASGETKKDAYQSAASLACSMIASGVTERMGCPGTPPYKMECEKRE